MLSEDVLLRFGPFELDPAREELRRAGLVLRMSPQPFRILLLLASRAGEVVTREEIQREIWDDATYVDFEQGINSAIRSIRSILGDRSETARYVRTIPRRGYEFVATVERVARPGISAPPPPTVLPRPQRRRRMLPLLLVLVAALVSTFAGQHAAVPTPHERPEVIAVRPFRVIGGTTAIDGRIIEEELRAAIGNTLPAERVTIGDEKSATVFIDGTIQTSPAGFRLILSATRADDGTRIWTDTVDRPLDCAPRLPLETAYRITFTVADHFLPPPRREPKLRTRVSPNALALYRRARREHDRNDFARAAQLYEQVLREEPRFAEALSGLADLEGPAAQRGLSPQIRTKAAERAVTLARQALALQPDNVEAQSILGVFTAQRDYDLPRAEEILRRAVATDPGFVDAHFNLAMVLAMRGLVGEAFKELAIARGLDPREYGLHFSLPLFSIWAGRYEDADARYREILAVRPNNPAIRWQRMSNLALQARWSEASAEARRLMGEKPVPNADVTTYRDDFIRLEPFMHEWHRNRIINDYAMAMYYAQRYEPVKAMEWLESAKRNRAVHISHLLVDPRFEPLRKTPRFEKLIAETKLGRRL